MKILIITVGNRQIGWLCKDGIVRCVGSISNPNHVEEIYQDIAEPRPQTKYFARHLGWCLYQICQSQNSFNPVELLIDGKLIEEEIANGLTDIWLLCTDQPESVIEDYRSSDTLWIAELMSYKIRETYPDVTVSIKKFTMDIKDTIKVQEHFDQMIKDLISINFTDEQPTILIQNKGSVPAISTMLDIYGAALVRQYDVVRATPLEPSPMYVPKGDYQEAVAATTIDRKSISNIFFPIERDRIISAWSKGDFSEAKFWLQIHRKYDVLFKLAGFLDDATRKDIRPTLKSIKGKWLLLNKVKKLAGADKVDLWQKFQCLDERQTPAIIWEKSFQIPIYAQNGLLTDAFFLMAQTLERLLYQIYKRDKWLDKGWVIIPESMTERGIGKERFIPTFEDLISIWTQHYGFSSQCDFLDSIRNKRNKIVHDALQITMDEIKEIWSTVALSIEPIDESLLIPLAGVREHLGLPAKPLLQELYKWGLIILQS